MPIGERNRELCKDHGWSQADLGEAIGTGSRRISRYENGRLTPSIVAVTFIAQLYPGDGNAILDGLIAKNRVRDDLQHAR